MANAILSETIPFNDGTNMPLVGLGLFMGYGDKNTFLESCIASCKSAIDIGYRHFDTAWIYQSTEEGLGIAIREKIAERIVKREDLFVTTKLHSTGHRREEVVPSLKRSLQRLQLDYVDNYLVHTPCAMPPGEDFPRDENGKYIFEDDRTSLIDTWQGMEECKMLGLTKSIGVSNYNERQLQLTLDNCTISPSNHQVESHPFFTNKDMVGFCKKHNIVVVCYSPMGKPHRPWAQSADPAVVTDPDLTAIGNMYNKTPAQVALRFQVQRGLPVVPKSSDPGRQRQNIDIFDFSLSNDDIAEIFDKCDKYDRVQPVINLKDSKEYPF